MPAELRDSKRYREHGDFTISGLASAGRGRRPVLDIVVHSLANGPEVKKPLLETSRKGYLGAVSASAYSIVSMVQRFGPMMRPGGAFLSLTYMASGARDPRLRRRHVVGEGRARERHARRSRSRPAASGAIAST